MNNLYLIESDDHQLIELEIKKILQEHQASTEELIRYDLEEVNISSVVNDLDTYGFFSQRKIIYGKNASFLSATKQEIEHDIEGFTKYINNPKEDSILIVSCRKLDGKKNICKLIKSKFKCIELEINRSEYIRKKLVGYEIKNEVINYLIDVIGESLDHLDNELNKLLLYKEDERVITKEDIDLIVIKKVDDNIYTLIDAIINKNKKKSLAIYQEMINYGEEVFKIFISLANQIRLIYQVKVLKNLPNEEIKDLLRLKNPKQVSAIRFRINNYSEKDLIDYLYKLAIMDEQLKLGKAIDKIIFPVFIANL